MGTGRHLVVGCSLYFGHVTAGNIAALIGGMTVCKQSYGLCLKYATFQACVLCLVSEIWN